MARLSFGALTAKEDMSIPRLFQLIRHGPLNSPFIFPDTCFITKPMHPRFWRLGAGRKLAFPEMTARELSGWSANPFYNQFLHTWLPRALQRCLEQDPNPNASYRTTDVIGTVENLLMPFSVGVANAKWFQHFGYDHYVKILSIRKLLGRVAFRDCEATIGRAPDEKEFRRYLSDHYHERLAPIAFKGWRDFGKRNYLADEELVVTAVLTAILTARETLILTWDTDIFDQFAQLVSTLAADYAAFRYAEMHAHEPEICPLRPLAIPPNFGKDAGFKGSEVRSIILREQAIERMWPQSYTPVHAYCVLLGNNCVDPKVSVAAFCLEAEMEMLLRTKAETAGRNTSRFQGRNMIAGASLDEECFGTSFVLGEEEYVSYEGLTVSWHDRHAALKPDPLITKRYCLG